MPSFITDGPEIWNRVFAPTSAESSAEEAEENGDVFPIWRAFNLQLKLISGNESIDFIEKARSNQNLLVELVPRLTHNLIEAWDWRLAFHKIERHEDYSRIDLTSISPHPQNHGFQDWSKIVEVLRDGFILLAARDLSRARAVAEFWREADYPIFHRLYLFGIAEVDGMARSPDVVTYFKRYPDLIFAPACKREVLRFFRKRSGMLSKKAIEWICVRISKGLDRTLYRSMSAHAHRLEGGNARALARVLVGTALVARPADGNQEAIT